MTFLYELFQKIAYLLVRFLSQFAGSEKLKLFVSMRQPQEFVKALASAQNNLHNFTQENGKKPFVIWFHVASAGELEQAVPVARALSEKWGVRFFLTYFSPSAIPFVKNFPALLGSSGMPLDLVQNADRIITTLQIQHVFFVRYDLWPGMLMACRKAHVPVSVLSATAATTHEGIWGALSQKIKSRRYVFVNHLFATHESDVAYFQKLNLPARIYLAGDSKWSRAKERSENLKRSGLSAKLRPFAQLCMMQKVNLGRKCFVFGSPHAEEQEVALRLLDLNPKCLVVFVPPEIGPEHLKRISTAAKAAGHKTTYLSELLENLNSAGEQFSGHEPERETETDVDASRPTHLLSRASPSHWLNARVKSDFPSSLVNDVQFVLVDQMGFLAELYSLADVAIVGGGFDGQIHNTLEPAAHPVATIYGKNFARAAEAKALAQAGAALTFGSPEELFQFLRNCARLQDISALGTAPAQQLAELKLRSLELFKQIPNTSEVVSCALFPGQEPI